MIHQWNVMFTKYCVINAQCIWLIRFFQISNIPSSDKIGPHEFIKMFMSASTQCIACVHWWRLNDLPMKCGFSFFSLGFSENTNSYKKEINWRYYEQVIGPMIAKTPTEHNEAGVGVCGAERILCCAAEHRAIEIGWNSLQDKFSSNILLTAIQQMPAHLGPGEHGLREHIAL